MLQATSWKIKASVFLVSGMIVGTFAIPSHELASIERGKEKADMCTACHGADGNGVAPAFPRLAGQHANYLAHALSSYRSGQRNNAIMGNIAKPLQDEDIKDLANYFAALPGKLTTLPRR